MNTALQMPAVARHGHQPSAGAWLQVLAHLDPKYGGMSAAVPSLSVAVHKAGAHAVSLAGFCVADEQYPGLKEDVPVFRVPAGYARWLKDAQVRETFQNLIGASCGVHIHGLWEQSTLVGIRSARRAGKPYVVSAHGMLQAWALNNRRLKKALYGALIERSNLSHASCLHALTTAEAQDYRDYGLKNPIAVIPNGVAIPRDADAEDFLQNFPHLRGKRLVLFLSRIHRKKGLDILCRAWANLAKRWPDAHLVLAGPDFEDTRTSVESMVASSGLTERVTFTGMLTSRLKWGALRAAHCYTLPSYSEGLSVSVLEAMGMGVPVVITRQCNLPEVAEYGCGWVIEANASELESALHECLDAPSTTFARMRASGQQLVDQSYSWEVVGQRMSQVYTWLQGGPRPTSVIAGSGGGH
jgi:glycosyltransferase involved in cell wall biosynthesis